MFKNSLSAAVALVAFMATGTAGAAETDAAVTFSATAQPGFFYDEGRYVKVDLVPHVMRDADAKMAVSATPSAGASQDDGRYVKLVEAPHTMPARGAQHIHASTAAPGLLYEEGAYHGYR